MRMLGRAKVLALLAAIVLPAGWAVAQGAATHHVAVTIPTVLRLRIDDGEPVDRAAVDLLVTVLGGRTSIDPVATRVEVRANTGWALDAQFRPTGDTGRLPLGATLDGTTWLPLTGGARLASGPATDGWRPFTVAYGLLASLSDGTYQGAVVYTLTQP